jgi:hypothetical protein
MPLSQQQLEKIQSWLDSSAFTAKCPVCGQRNFDIKEPVHFPAFDPNTGTEAPFNALVVIICTICAHVFFFDAVSMGLKRASPSDPPARPS